MVLHLFPAEKFTVAYVKKIHELFDEKNHIFIIFGEQRSEYHLEEIKKMDHVLFTQTITNLGSEFDYYVETCSIMICHSLFFKLIDLYKINRLVKIYKKKIAWVIWGKDLYEDYEKSKRLKAHFMIKPIIKESIRKSFISKVSIFITAGDYDALKKRYQISPNVKVLNAQYTYDFIDLIEKKQNEKVNIMVGHSATETCRHLETFEMLKDYVGKVRIFCPMSYPADKEYVEIISNRGEEIFGHDFIAITNFMKYEDYIYFLNTIDIGIFNNSRQQGMGNVTNLLYLGKKVYLSRDNTIRKSYKKDEYTIFDCDEIGRDDFLLPLADDQILNNRNNVVYKFSDENLYKEWRLVFES